MQSCPPKRPSRTLEQLLLPQSVAAAASCIASPEKPEMYCKQTTNLSVILGSNIRNDSNNCQDKECMQRTLLNKARVETRSMVSCCAQNEAYRMH